MHAFQTAERIREKYPGEGTYDSLKSVIDTVTEYLLYLIAEYDWFHLTGLIHDTGKILALWGEPQVCTQILFYSLHALLWHSGQLLVIRIPLDVSFHRMLCFLTTSDRILTMEIQYIPLSTASMNLTVASIIS